MSLSKSHAKAFADNNVICNTRLGAVLGDKEWTEIGVAAGTKPAVLYFSPRGRILKRIVCKDLQDAMDKFGDICVMSLEGDNNGNDA